MSCTFFEVYSAAMKQKFKSRMMRLMTLRKGWKNPSFLSGFLALIAVITVETTARAEVMPLPDQGRYTVLHQTLSEAITQFCGDVDLRVIIDPSVEGNVRSGFTAATPRAFLDALTAEYHLDWYYDGNTLYITPASAASSHTFSLDGVPYARLRRAIDAKKMLEPHYSVHEDSNGDAVTAFGPPRMLERIDQTIQLLKTRAAHQTVTIFRGGAVQQVPQ